MVDPSTNRTLRIYPLVTITRWEVSYYITYTCRTWLNGMYVPTLLIPINWSHSTWPMQGVDSICDVLWVTDSIDSQLPSNEQLFIYIWTSNLFNIYNYAGHGAICIHILGEELGGRRSPNDSTPVKYIYNDGNTRHVNGCMCAGSPRNWCLKWNRCF